MTKEQIQQIRKRCDKASHAPWDWHTNRHPNCDGTPWGWVSGVACVNPTWKGHKGRDNAIFITHARTDIPALLDEVERLQAESAQLQAERDAAVELIAKLIMLCEVPQKDCDKVFRRLHIGAGDYMGSGYAFIDAYNRILNEFFETVNEDFYKLIRCEIDLRGAKAKEESENARYI